MKKTIRAALWGTLLASIVFSSAVNARRTRSENSQGEVAFAIELPSASLNANQALGVRVEVRNLGSKDIFVCRDLMTIPCEIRFSVEPRAKVVRTSSSFDCMPKEARPKNANTNIEPFEELLRKTWISLPAGGFYGTAISLSPATYPELRIPGKYKISAEWSSGGFAPSDCYPVMENYPSEIAKLSTVAWVGSIKSNEVTITVSAGTRQ